MGFANYCGWSDVAPYEVIRRISDKCLEVRAMSAELDPTWTPEVVVGGFAGHCVNNGSQQWRITSDPTEEVLRIRLHKDGTWKSKYGQRFTLSDRPVKFRDYNF